MLFVGSTCPLELVVDETFPREPGLLGILIRMRAVVALGEVGEVGGEGSTEIGAGVSGEGGRDNMKVVMKECGLGKECWSLRLETTSDM